MDWQYQIRYYQITVLVSESTYLYLVFSFKCVTGDCEDPEKAKY